MAQPTRTEFSYRVSAAAQQTSEIPTVRMIEPVRINFADENQKGRPTAEVGGRSSAVGLLTLKTLVSLSLLSPIRVAHKWRSEYFNWFSG